MSTEYIRKFARREAMQWQDTDDLARPDLSEIYAMQVVAWVNANGGEARYVPLGEDTPIGWSGYPRIAVRIRRGWAYGAPGCYFMKDVTDFLVVGNRVVDHEYWDNGHGQAEHAPYCKCEERQLSEDRRVRAFHIFNPEEFEQEWEEACAAPRRWFSFE